MIGKIERGNRFRASEIRQFVGTRKKQDVGIGIERRTIRRQAHDKGETAADMLVMLYLCGGCARAAEWSRIAGRYQQDGSCEKLFATRRIGPENSEKSGG